MTEEVIKATISIFNGKEASAKLAVPVSEGSIISVGVAGSTDMGWFLVVKDGKFVIDERWRAAPAPEVWTLNADEMVLPTWIVRALTARKKGKAARLKFFTAFDPIRRAVSAPVYVATRTLAHLED